MVPGVDRRHEENCLWVALHHHQQDRLWHIVVYQVTVKMFENSFCCEITTGINLCTSVNFY